MHKIQAWPRNPYYEDGYDDDDVVILCCDVDDFLCDRDKFLETVCARGFWLKRLKMKTFIISVSRKLIGSDLDLHCIQKTHM